MGNTNRRRPAYLTISDSLRGRIERHELKPGERFPTERELVQEFNVARMTVRHALDILQIEGLIDRRRGRTGGTFVRAIPPALSLTSKEGFIEQLRALGHETADSVVSLSRNEVLRHVAVALGIEDGTPVWELKRVHCIDGLPVIFSYHTFPVALVPDLRENELTAPIPQLLAAAGCPPVYKREAISTTTAGSEEQRLLKVSRGHPLLRLMRILKAADGTVVDYVEESLRADAVNIELEMGEDPAPTEAPRLD